LAERKSLDLAILPRLPVPFHLIERGWAAALDEISALLAL
jgi:hypothetical protein